MPPKKFRDVGNPNKIQELIDRPRVGSHNYEDYPLARETNPTQPKERKLNAWIEFARHYANTHGITLGCAIKNKECRLDYHDSKPEKRPVPKQLQDWVEHNKALSAKTNNTLACCVSNVKSQKQYHTEEKERPLRKSPAKVLTVAELEQKLNRLHTEYKQPNTPAKLKSIDANIIRTRILLDKLEHKEIRKGRLGNKKIREDDSENDEEGGSIGQVARLGHPTQPVENYKLSIKTPTPSINYNRPFADNDQRDNPTSLRSKFSGRGMISHHRDGLLFDVNSSVFPM